MENCHTTFNEAQPSYHVSCMTIFFRKDFTSSKRLPWRQGLPSSKKRYLFLQKHPICGKVQCNTPFSWSSAPVSFFAWYLLFKGKTSLVQNNDAYFVQIFHSYNMEGHIAHIQPWRVSYKKYYTHPRVLVHHSNAVLCIVAWFSIKWFTPLWRRLCTYLHQHFP